MKRFSECTPVLLAVSLLAIGWPLMAWAQEDFEQGVDTARQLLESQRYEEALVQIERLKPRAPDKEQRADLDIYEGLVLSNMGRRTQDRASVAFRSALQLNPQARLPVKVPPRLERTFEELRARVLKEQAGRPGPMPEVPAEVPSSPLAAEPMRAGAGVSGDLDMTDRLRLLSQWSALTAPAPPAPSVSVPVTETFRYKASRPRVLVPAITGGALVVSGGVFWGLAKREQSRLQNEDLRERTLEDARLMAARGERYQNWAVGATVAGGVALGVATVLYVLQVPKPPVTLGTNGSSAFLQGAWQ